MNWEIRFLYWLQSHRTPRRDRFWYAVTWLGYGAGLPLLTSVLLLISPSYKMTGFASLTAIGVMELLFNHFLKAIIGRDRPFAAHPELVAVGREPGDKSFPSGHTSSAFACALIFCAALPVWAGVIALTVASMIAFSRVYLAVHYPTDVLGGIFAAILVDSVVLCFF